MNEHEATIYLSKYLNEKGNLRLVYNKVAQKRLEKEAIAFEFTDDNNSNLYSHIVTNSCTEGVGYHKKVKNAKGQMQVVSNLEIITINMPSSSREQRLLLRDYAKELAEEDIMSKTKEANYLFVDQAESINDEYAGFYILEATPLAIITHSDLEMIKELSKGNLGILENAALDILNVKQYAQYDFLELAKENPKKFCNYFEDVSKQKKESIIYDLWDLIEEEKLHPEIKTFLRKEDNKEIILDVGRDKISENGDTKA